MKTFICQSFLFFVVLLKLISLALSQDINFDYNDNNYTDGEDLERKWNFLNNNGNNNNNGNLNVNDNKEQNDESSVLRSDDTYVDSQENTFEDETYDNDNNQNNNNNNNNNNTETVKIAGGNGSQTNSGTVSIITSTSYVIRLNRFKNIIFLFS